MVRAALKSSPSVAGMTSWLQRNTETEHFSVSFNSKWVLVGFLIKYFVTKFQNQSSAQIANMPLTSGLRKLRQHYKAAADQPNERDPGSETKQWSFPLLEGLPASSKFYCANRKETTTQLTFRVHTSLVGEGWGTANIPAVLLGCVHTKSFTGRIKCVSSVLTMLACPLAFLLRLVSEQAPWLFLVGIDL